MLILLCSLAALIVTAGVRAAGTDPEAVRPSRPLLKPLGGTTLGGTTCRAGERIVARGSGYGTERGDSYLAFKRAGTGATYRSPHYYRWSDEQVSCQVPGVVSGGYYVSITTSRGISTPRRYKVRPHTITCKVTGGHGTVSPATRHVEHGASARIDIRADPGYGPGTINDNGVSRTIATPYIVSSATESHRVEVGFKPLPFYSISAAVGPGGSIGTSGDVKVRQGRSKSFTVTPHTGYRMKDLLIDSSDAGQVSRYTFSNVVSNHRITATFEPVTDQPVVVSSKAGEHGTITPSGQHPVSIGGSISFAFTPDPHYRVADVRVDGASVGAVLGYTFVNVTGDHNIEATFTQALWTVTGSAGPGGIVSPSGSQAVADGSDVTLTVAPEPHHETVDVTLDGKSLGPVPIVTLPNVTSDHLIVVDFAPITWSLTVKEGKGGSVSPGGTQRVVDGSDMGFSITADPHYRISDVLVDGVSAGPLNTYAFEDLAIDHSIEARFTRVVWTVKATAGAWGGISPSGARRVFDGDTVTLKMTPDVHFHVVDVRVDGISLGPVGSCQLSNVTSDHVVVASFERTFWTVTGAAGQHGSIDPAGPRRVADGADLKFKITVEEHYRVADVLVDGVSIGSERSCELGNITGDHQVDVVFGPVTWAVTATAGANGTIDPGGRGKIMEASDQTFNIRADEHYHVADVRVDGRSVGPVEQYTFRTVVEPHRIVARFARTTRTVTTVAFEHGSIDRYGISTRDEGTDVDLKIDPDEHYKISKVTVDGVRVPASANLQLTHITANHNVVASFEPILWTVTVRTGANGTIGPAGVNRVMDGSGMTFRIAPKPHYHIKDLTLDGVSLGPLSNYSMKGVTADHVVKATFEQTAWNIAARPGANGDIYPSGTSKVADGKSRTMKIEASGHYHIADVKVDGVSVGPVSKYTFSNVVAGHRIEASFELTAWRLRSAAGTFGSVTPAGTRKVLDGQSMTFEISGSQHHRVLDVKVDGISVGPMDSYSFTNVTADHTIEAVFERPSWTVMAAAGDHGQIDAAGKHRVIDGAGLRFAIRADPHYEIADVKVDGASVGALSTYRFSDIGADHRIVASFRQKTWRIVTTASRGGTVVPRDSKILETGSDTFKIVPDPHYALLDVKVDGASVGPMKAYTFNSVSADHKVEASFAPVTWTVSARSMDENGTISPAGFLKTQDGRSKTFTMTPDRHCHLKDVVVDGESVGALNNYTFSHIERNHYIVAYFAGSTWPITAGAGDNGTVSPEGTAQVPEESPAIYRVTPDAGYQIEDVKVDGVSVGPVRKYKFDHVTGGHTISATFSHSPEQQ